jgi:hypothetical protein
MESQYLIARAKMHTAMRRILTPFASRGSGEPSPADRAETRGAAPSERTRAMPGDSVVVDPTYSATLAIAIHARPEAIWPWLVQMG